MAICGHNAISLISFAKQSLISVHNEMTLLQLLKDDVQFHHAEYNTNTKRCTSLELKA